MGESEFLVIQRLQEKAMQYVESTPEWGNKFAAMRRAVRMVESVEKSFYRANMLAEKTEQFFNSVKD